LHITGLPSVSFKCSGGDYFFRPHAVVIKDKWNAYLISDFDVCSSGDVMNCKDNINIDAFQNFLKLLSVRGCGPFKVTTRTQYLAGEKRIVKSLPCEPVNSLVY
jgi:hypothetical protein